MSESDDQEKQLLIDAIKELDSAMASFDKNWERSKERHRKALVILGMWDFCSGFIQGITFGRMTHSASLSRWFERRLMILFDLKQ